MNNTEIEATARERLYLRLLAQLDEKGVEGIELGPVLEHAGVSRADFEASYGGIEECLFDAYEELTAQLDAEVRSACRSAPPGSNWPGRVRIGLRALLTRLAAEPQIASVLLRSFPAIGPKAQARSQSFVESFGPMLAPGRELAEDDTELPAEVEMLATGAAEAIVFEEIASDRAEDLEAMLPSLVFSLLVPFVGPVRATEEMERAKQPG